MAALIDLTQASVLETRSNAGPATDKVFGLTSSVQASRSYHIPLLRQSQHSAIDDQEGIDLSGDNNGRSRLRMLNVATPSHKDFIAPSLPLRKLSNAIHADAAPKKRMLSMKSTSNPGKGYFQATTLSQGLEVPIGRLSTRTTSPATKRRRIGPCGPTGTGEKMNLTPSLQSEVKLKDGKREGDVIDLAITDNFPTRRCGEAGPKKGTIRVLDEPDGSEEPCEMPKCTFHPSRPHGLAINIHEVAASRKLAAPGIKRRLTALGLSTNIHPPDIIDLSVDSESEAEDEPNTELMREHSSLPSGVGPEDYLDDDEISKLLADLDIGPHGRLFAPPEVNRTEIEEFVQGNSRYKAGKNAQLRDGNFLRIVSVLKNENNDIFLSGHLLSRQSCWGRAMPKRKNELVWMMQISTADFEAGYDPHPTEVPLTEATGIRSVTFTNQKYPEMSLKTYADGWFQDTHDELSTGPLFCRWKNIRVIGERKQKLEESIVHLGYAEADPAPRARIRPCMSREMWRGSKTTLGGSHMSTRPPSINLATSLSDSLPEHIQQYTFGDAFCGAGGCSSGASQAGLHVRWGFDKDKATIKVYATELGQREGAECLDEAVDEFCARSDIDRFMVDILHLSPPCQPFSAAHTVPSEIQDEINQAALLSVGHVLEKIKPRVVTIEETEGLVNRHTEWFHALINIFVSLGYGVRWRVVHCGEYGIPQQRKRLWVIAAGPGESLPPIARPTHGGPGSGLQAFKKIRHYIRDIPPSATQHDTSDRFRDGPRLPFSDDQFAKTLTCSGGVGNYHPSGLRFYTIREAASLQTFPLWYTFTLDSKTKARRQIGNAVPPLLARTIYREVIRSLKESDRQEALWEGISI